MRWGMLLTCLMMIALVGVSAQANAQEAEACPALVSRALDSMADNCGEVGRNTACYGYSLVQAAFAETVEDNFFSEPSQQAPLATLTTLQTSPLDVELDRWGIAVMNVQANIPNTLPGQSVVFVLMGDVQVSNAVAEDALPPEVEPVTIITLVGANVRSRPSQNANVLISAPAGTDLPADGISENGQFLRVVYQDIPGWVSLMAVDVPDGMLATLPTLSDAPQSPMQAFYFSTGFSAPECNEAPPSTLVVQGPEGITVDLTANGVDIRLSSAIALRTGPDNSLSITVLAGSARVEGVGLPAGFGVEVQLPETFDLEAALQQPQIVAPPEIVEVAMPQPLDFETLDQLTPLEDLPGELMNYDLDLPTISDIQAVVQEVSAPPVQPTLPPAVIDAPVPVISNPQPAPPVSLPGLPTSTPIPAFYAPIVTSPTNGSVFNIFPRYTNVAWDAVPGAENYTVIVEYYDPFGGAWYPMSTGTGITGTTHTFEFVGAQPGRVRVCAVRNAGAEQLCSGWIGFEYTI
jgi:hypothetical protein